MKIAFSILHFGPYEVTKECIDSILKLNNFENCEIIIVDNFSANGSIEKLKKEYDEYTNIHFLCNAENLGFAKGNNVGFNYAKVELNADVICVLNNDIVIQQNDFILLLNDCLKKYDVDVVAPSIINSKGYFQNPLRMRELSIFDICYALFYNFVMSIVYTIPYINIKVANVLENRRNVKRNEETKKCVESIVPHGAAIIYGQKYIHNENVAFLENTFLFCEEDMLFEYLKQKKYKILYYPKLCVLHYEDASIRAVTSDFVKKRKFVAKQKISSLLSLLKFRLKI